MFIYSGVQSPGKTQDHPQVAVIPAQVSQGTKNSKAL